MPGWDSLETVSRLHASAQIAGLILLAVLVALIAFAAIQLRKGLWPRWLDIGEFQIRSRFVEIACAIVLCLLLMVEVVAYAYGSRATTLAAAAEQVNAERIKRLTGDLQQARREQKPPEAPNRYLKENSELRQKLAEAENRLAELEKAQSQKRLSDEQKRFLIEALRPFAGQKVQIGYIRGDDESKAFADDFVSVFETAGWDHNGNDGVFSQQWPRDPVGVEVTLNEKDARAGNIPAGIGALINATRQLGLVYDNTIYMGSEVPAGEVLVKVGKKLRR